MIEKMTELDLKGESVKFSAHYLKTVWGNVADLVRRHDIVNTAANSFFAGVRFAEHRMGATNGNQQTMGGTSPAPEAAIPPEHSSQLQPCCESDPEAGPEG